MMDPSVKKVSIILAIRNEERNIRKCLDSLVNQDFPHEKYEILIIDGMSNDATREIISKYSSKFSNLIRIFDNLKGTAGQGRNIGIRNSRGKTIYIMGGHSYADRSLLTKLTEELDQSSDDVAGVGSIHISPNDESFVGKIIASVQKSPLGGFGTSFMPGMKKVQVKSLAFCLYKKEVLLKIGLHDENFIVGQDFELNFRIRKAGYKLLCLPEPLVYYYRRYDSLQMFSKRMFNYGIARTLITKKHPNSFPVFLILPVLLVLSTASLPFLLLFSPTLAKVVAYGLVLYIAVVMANSLYVSILEKNPKYFISILFYLSEHFSYGSGVIAGILRK